VAVADWSADLARRAGAELAQDPQKRVGDVIASNSRFGEVEGPGARLGAFYGELGNTIMANVDDTKKAVAEAAGILSFFVSKLAGQAAGVVGVAVGGGIGGIVAAYGADQLGKATEAYIRNAETELATAKDANELKAMFMGMVITTMEQTTAVSLWADDSIRASLLAGGLEHKGAKPPPVKYDGKSINPPLEDPPGHLRIPAPDDHPAYEAFNAWFEGPDAGPLKAAAAAALQNSGMREAFDETLLEGLFKKA
jgi:hypothetical protein